MNIIAALFRPPQAVPKEYQKTFLHLFLDIAWFGLLSGSAVGFVAIYAARLGASVQQLGLLSAAPAVMNLLVALPAGKWLENHAQGRPVFWAALIHRLFYLLWIPLPLMLAPGGQIWAIITITFIMNIPGTALAVGFNALFGDVVPPEWRAYTTGIRNALLSITSILAGLICGQILIRVGFPQNYQIVFGIGVIGAVMSTVQLWYLRSARRRLKAGKGADTPVTPPPSLKPAASSRIRLAPRWHFISQLRGSELMRFEILNGSFGRVLSLLFCFHLAQFLSIPLFSIYMVDSIHLTDQTISFGSAMFNFTVFLGSTQLVRIVPRLGNQKVTGWGVVLLSFYPALMALSRGPGLYLFTSFIGGFAWALAGGALYNYLLERVPDNDRPSHMAWYNLALNAAILLGSLFGPAVAGVIGLQTAMWVFAGARLLAGTAILRWG